jgi:hypothetical protein
MVHLKSYIYRYFHAGECVPIMQVLFIFGGLVKNPYQEREYTASKEMWRFNIGPENWSGPRVSLSFLYIIVRGDESVFP